MNPALETTHSSRGFFFLALSAALWGTVPVATNAIYQVAETNALSIGFFRLGLSLLVLVPASLHVTTREQWRIPRRYLVVIFLFGAAMALYQVCYFASIPLVGVTVASLVTLCTAPIMVALLAALFTGEALTRRVMLAMVGALVGTALLIGVEPPAGGTRAEHLRGVLLALGAALGFALVLLSTRALTGRYHSLQLIAIGMGSGALVLLPFALAVGFVVHYPPSAWVLLLHLGLVPTALGYIFFFYGLRYTLVTVASIINLLEPLTSMILARLLFSESLGQWSILGAGLLLSAMALLYWRPAPGDDMASQARERTGV